MYRARDSKLGRDVALKVLPESLGNDAHYGPLQGQSAHVRVSESILPRSAVSKIPASTQL